MTAAACRAPLISECLSRFALPWPEVAPAAHCPASRTCPPLNFAAPTRATDRDPGVRPERRDILSNGLDGLSPTDIDWLTATPMPLWNPGRHSEGLKRTSVCVRPHAGDLLTGIPHFPRFALLSFPCFTFPVCVFQVGTMAELRGRLPSKGVCPSLRL